MDVLKAKSTKSYLKCAVSIGLPVILQNMVSSCINTLDVFMLGQLGEVAITASSMSNQWFLLYVILVNGIASAGGMFISQYWGSRDHKSIHQCMGILFYGTMGLALFFTVFSMAAPGTVIGFYSMDEAVIKEGISYLRIIGISYILYAFNCTFSTALRSIGSTKVPMTASIISLICNAVLNYLFIFGHGGFPQMGVKGAAIATAIARTLEVSVTLGYVIWKKPPIYGKLKDYLCIQGRLVRKFFRFGFLVIMGEVVYAIGNNLYNVAYKYTGTEAQASLQIVQTLSNLALLFCGGFGTAASVMLGTMLGRNEFKKAKDCAKTLTGFAMIISVISGIFVFLAGPLFLQLFQIGENSKGYVEIMIRIMACSIPIRTLVFMIICGMLRSGGDNLYSFFGNLFGVWCIGLPVVFLAAVVLKAPIYVVYLMSIAEEAGKLLICGPRVLKGKWIRNLTE